METNIYNKKGEVAGKMTLPESVFGAKVSKNAIHDVVTALQGNARAGTAHTKFRGEVRGGGKKPWKQKGTGRARHGSSRSPIWVGGGTTHGPRSEKNYGRKVNKKALTSALYGVLTAKLKDGEIIFVDTLAMDAFSTKSAQGVLSALAKGTKISRLADSKNIASLLLLPTADKKTVKSFGNISSVEVEQWKNLNPLMALSRKYMIIGGAEEAIAFFAGKKVKVKKK